MSSPMTEYSKEIESETPIEDVVFSPSDKALRFFTADGELVPTLEEATELAQHQVEVEKQKVAAKRQNTEVAQQRVQLLADKLRELGVNPDEL